MYLEGGINEDGEEFERLTKDGLLTVARWAAAAVEQDTFDWNLICADAQSDKILAERTRLVRWMHEMHFFDDLLLDDPDEEYPDEVEFFGSWKEDAGAVLITFFIASVQVGAAKENMTPEDFIGRFKGHG